VGEMLLDGDAVLVTEELLVEVPVPVRDILTDEDELGVKEMDLVELRVAEGDLVDVRVRVAEADDVLEGVLEGDSEIVGVADEEAVREGVRVGENGTH